MSTKITVHTEEAKRDPWEGVLFPCVAENVENGDKVVAEEIPVYPLRWKPVNAIYDTPPPAPKADPWEGVSLPWPCKDSKGANGVAYPGDGCATDGKLWFVSVEGMPEFVSKHDLTPLPGDSVTVTFEREKGGEV